MFLRISSALALVMVLAACGAAESLPPPGDAVECAIGAGADVSPVCTLERVAGGKEIVLHHPDGGFRRLARDPATGALSSRDGAEDLVPEQARAGAIAFSVGADRYRIPAALLASPQ